MMQKPVRVQEVSSTITPADADEIDLLAVAATLWRGKLWILLGMMVTVALGAYSTFVATVPLYRARTQMALQVSAPPVLDIESMVAGFSGDNASINTEMSVVTSGELIGQLVDELHLDRDPEFNPHLPDPGAPPGLLPQARAALGALVRPLLGASAPAPELTAEEIRQDVVDAVREAVVTESGRDTYVFSISATTRDPAKSALLANTLGHLYRDDQINAKVEATERLATWLSQRVGELRAELDARQGDIADLRARSALVSDESLQALNAQAIELRSELAQAQSELAQVDERLAALQAANVSGDVGARVQAAQDGRLESMAQAVAADEPGAQARFDRRYAQLLLQGQAERERGQKAVEDLQRSVNELSAQFESQSSDLQALQQLEQDAEATRVLYETFLARLKEATAQETAHQADSRILTLAAPGEQVVPRPARSLALALLLGLLLGAGAVLLREFLQRTFRTAEDLERHTGRPVLGEIPRIPARARLDTIRYLLDKPTSAAAEAVRNLRTSLLLSNVDRPPRVIMTTSSVPNEGKTTVSIALAQNLAGLDKKVLLVEGDIRRRTFNAYFSGNTTSGGLLSVVSGERTLEAVVLRPAGHGIDVLMGERSSVNAADLFSSERFHQFLESARAVYDYVIIDTPPVLVVPDARVIAQQVDAVVYIVQWDSTSQTQVEEGLRQFRSVGAPIAGLVLSRIDPRGMRRYGYGGRYGPYSRYGRKYYDA